MIYTIITVICIAIMSVAVLSVVFTLIRKKHGERLKYIRTFKKGKCTVIFIPAVILYFIGNLYAGDAVVAAFFDALSKIVQLVVLKYDTGNTEALMAANGLYAFAIYMAFTLVALNACMLAVSMFDQNIDYFMSKTRFMYGKKPLLLIYGNNEQNIAIYKSDKENKYRKYIVDDFSDNDKAKLYFGEIDYLDDDCTESMLEKIAKGEHVQIDNYFTVIIDTDSDERNIQLCQEYVDTIGKIKSVGDNEYMLFEKVNVYVFGDLKFESIYSDLVDNGCGCIHYVNKYKMLAMDFVGRHPLTKFMDEEQLDYERSVVRDGVDINVFMVGFGKTNRQIFLTSVATNQFVQADGDDVTLKPVNYYLFDKADAKNDKNLNHSYYRYEHFVNQYSEEELKNNFLPLPTDPAIVTVPRKLDVNDYAFYDTIHNIASKNLSDANFVVLAFESDLENIDMAKKLYEKKLEWGLKNFIIFVKVRDAAGQSVLKDIEDSVYIIADEKTAIYNISALTNDQLTGMTRLRNVIYDLEYAAAHGTEMTDEVIAKQRRESDRRWFVGKNEFERESNIYCCLSIRSKLNMMGLDCCEKSDPRPGLTNEEYLARYAKGDMPQFMDGLTVEGKQVIDYPADFKISRRKNMAEQEHLRWNSFMLTKGFVPASVDQIVNEKIGEKFTNGKRYDLRRHGNLTTFDGLLEFRRLISEKRGVPEAETDVIKYDYQILDDAHWLLDRNGLKIVKKEEI